VADSSASLFAYSLVLLYFLLFTPSLAHALTHTHVYTRRCTRAYTRDLSLSPSLFSLSLLHLRLPSRFRNSESVLFLFLFRVESLSKSRVSRINRATIESTAIIGHSSSSRVRVLCMIVCRWACMCMYIYIYFFFLFNSFLRPYTFIHLAIPYNYYFFARPTSFHFLFI